MSWEAGWRDPCTCHRVRAKTLGWIVLAFAVAVVAWRGGFEFAVNLATLATGSPHDRYAARLRLGWVAGADDGAAWLRRADEALRNPRRAVFPLREDLIFHRSPDAVAFAMPLRRGQRLVADTDVASGAGELFLDVFRRAEPRLRRVGDAAGREPRLQLEIREDGDYIVRVQPELGAGVALVVRQRIEPTLRIPVEGATAASIRSAFGAPRDNGRREHAGIDIFAPRGTNVVAAADGIVTSVGTNRLGGKVVWVLRPTRGEALYYAHLDTQMARVGARVQAGDVLGTVGNTGNARTTPPHLHFGIYAARGAVDPLPYIATIPERASSTRAASNMILAKEDP